MIEKVRELLKRFSSKDIGIDLGTSTVLVYVEDKGIVINEPSVVAIDTAADKIIKVGRAAQDMVGRTPDHIKTVRPLKNGVVAQYEVTLRMLQYFIRKACGDMFFRPRVMICIPGSVSDVEKRAVMDAALEAGARTVRLIEEPLAAAVGAGININAPEGHLIVDIGGGATDIAVVSLGGIVVSESIRVAGDQFDEAIVEHVRKKYQVHIGERTAEQIKIRIGAVYEHKNEKLMKVRGRCLKEGLPKEITISSREMLEAMMEPISDIVEAICRVVERTPPELVPDILNNGITMTGGGSLLAGLDLLITDITGIKAHVAKDPVSCVAIGTGKSLSKLAYGQSYEREEEKLPLA
jgi:rod shape-determining protein MreB